MSGSNGHSRIRTLRAVVFLIFGAIILRLAYIQLVDTKYKDMAQRNVLHPVTLYPARGEVYDRNGEFLVQSRECYDFMVVYKDLPRSGFDTLRICGILGITPEKLERELHNASMRPRAPRRILSFVPKEAKLLLDECNLRGFYTVYRTERQYPRKIGGNLLGYVGEVSPEMLKRYPGYNAGDYIGLTGVEAAYEDVLKGRNGLRIEEIDTHGAIKGSYMDGAFDTLPEHGKSIVCTIDARLQLFAEELMQGKVGAAVAIEPSTGKNNK